MTHQEFANLLGINKSSLSNMIAGLKRPSLELAVKIEKLTKGKVKPRDWVELKEELRKEEEEKEEK